MMIPAAMSTKRFIHAVSNLLLMIPCDENSDLRFTTAERRAFDTINARLNGEIIPTPEVPAEGSGLLMREALKRWSEGGGRGAKKPRERTIFEAKAALDRFIELHGDLPVISVSKAHARTFRDTLIKVPKALPASWPSCPCQSC